MGTRSLPGLLIIVNDRIVLSATHGDQDAAVAARQHSTIFRVVVFSINVSSNAVVFLLRWKNGKACLAERDGGEGVEEEGSVPLVSSGGSVKCQALG